MSNTVYQIVTDRIVRALESGVIPWRRPWSEAAGGSAMSLSTGKAYRGINALLLAPCVTGYSSPWWGTLRQVNALGGRVKKGERSSPCVFWKWLDGTDKASGERRRIPLLRYYAIFSADQCDGLKLPKMEDTRREFVPVDRCEAVVAGMPKRPVISEDGRGSCYYRPGTDSIHMTRRDAFLSAENYYATLFHEMIHSTGSKGRLGRDMSGGFGSKEYSREELVAEIGAAFLCAECAIDTAPLTENAAAYVQSWLRVLKEDARAVVVAAGAAQRAADFILARKGDEQDRAGGYEQCGRCEERAEETVKTSDGTERLCSECAEVVRQQPALVPVAVGDGTLWG